MSACPSLNFSCTNISCSIWFCCGGGGGPNKEPQPSPPVVPNNNPQPSPPSPQVIKVPDHLREPSTTYVEKPAPQPLAPLPSYSYTPPVAETAPPPRHEPPTATYYPPRTQPPPPPQPPSTTQQQATRPPTLQAPTLPAPPPKVYGSWTQTTPHTHPVPPVPVWSSQTQTPSSAPILPPSLASPPNKVLDDPYKPPPPQPPRPARQPSKTHHQTMPPTVDQLMHTAHSRLPSENYYYEEAALPDGVPPRAALPLGDSKHYVGFYAQERWE